jgi:hypothetical protein
MKMKNKKYLLMAGKAGFVVGAMLLVTATAPISYADGVQVGISVPVPVVPNVVVAPDNFVYYPSYGVYYNSYRHQYNYKDKDAWVSRPAPPGVSETVLQASPSVKMDFHDAPANHHAAMVQKYPKTWAPARSNEGPRTDEHREK